MSENEKPKNLVQKLCEVMAAVGYTQKTGWNEAQKYHYVTEADIAEKIRPELAKRNLFIFPTLVSNSRTKMERTNFKGELKVSYATDLVMRFTIVDGDSGEERICDVPGCSESPGDKGVYVAMTGSEKYLLMKAFLLPTGDDPEDDANEPEKLKEARKDAKATSQALGQAKAEMMAKNGSTRTTTAFYTFPEAHNGHKVEFINIAAFLRDNEDKADAVRLVLSAAGAKKTKDETAILPADNLQVVLEKLAGDLGVDVKQLQPKD